MDGICDNIFTFNKFSKQAFMKTERKEKGCKKAKQSQNMTLKSLKYQYLLIPLACIRIILILMYWIGISADVISTFTGIQL